MIDAPAFSAQGEMIHTESRIFGERRYVRQEDYFNVCRLIADDRTKRIEAEKQTAAANKRADAAEGKDRRPLEALVGLLSILNQQKSQGVSFSPQEERAIRLAQGLV